MVADEQILAHKTATDEVVHARVAPSAANGDGGFVVAARWAFSANGDGPGRIELFRTDATGSLIGSPAVLTDRSGGPSRSNANA